MNEVSEQDVQLGLEAEMLALLANQSRQLMIPVFMVSAIIASFASEYVPRSSWISWLVAVLAILIARAIIIPMLARRPNLSRRWRINIVMTLSLIHGCTHAYSLTFFPEMEILGRSMQTMLLAGLCMAAVSTSAGYIPFFFAFVLPILVPLMFVWITSIGGFGLTQLDLSVGLAVLLFGAAMTTVTIGMYRQFRDSFRIRQQQVELNRQLGEANDAKTRFLATASHDLRQPMQALTASIDSLRFQELDDETRAIVDDLNTAKTDLSGLLSALLDISRLDASVEDLSKTDFNLYRLLFAVWDEQNGNAQGKGLELSLNCPENARAVSNPVQFKRIISNLTTNAIRYTDSGSVKISARRAGSNFIVDVSDTGIGIDESEQTQIFEDFYQAIYPARSQQRGGLGLGLSIVRRLTEMLQIKLSLTSKLNEGSVFTVVVPAATGVSKAEEVVADTSFDLNGLEVLVVDDEATVANALKKMLESIHCVVRTAQGTEPALQLVKEKRPDVMLVDRRLQGTEDGIELIAQVRELHTDMPAILISGDTAPDRISEAEQAGIPLLVKPAQLAEIQQMIATVCA